VALQLPPVGPAKVTHGEGFRPASMGAETMTFNFCSNDDAIRMAKTYAGAFRQPMVVFGNQSDGSDADLVCPLSEFTGPADGILMIVEQDR